MVQFVIVLSSVLLGLFIKDMIGVFLRSKENKNLIKNVSRETIPLSDHSSSWTPADDFEVKKERKKPITADQNAIEKDLRAEKERSRPL